MLATIRSVALLFLLALTTLASSCGEDQDLGALAQSYQASGYTGPKLKIPLWAPFKWYVSTPVGGIYPDGEVDSGHVNRNYHSIDFDDYLIDGANVAHGNVNAGILQRDGTIYYPRIIPVLAAAKGKVVYVANSDCVPKGKTCVVLIEHENDYHTLYLHFINGSIVVEMGKEVQAGQILGYVGTTGTSSGTHVHFELLKREACSSKAWALWERIDETHCYQGWHDDPAFQGVTLEGRPWEDYKVGSFYPSTNGFTYTPSATNPSFCGATPQNGVCPQPASFKSGDQLVFSGLFDKVETDFCSKVVFLIGKNIYQDSPEYCSNGVASGVQSAWGAAYIYGSGSYTAQLYVRLKQNKDYLNYPVAERAFTITSTGVLPPPTPPPTAKFPPAPPTRTSTTVYAYANAKLTCSDQPMSSGYGYLCLSSGTTFKTSQHVYGMLRVDYLAPSIKYRFRTEVWHQGGLLATFGKTGPWIPTGYGGLVKDYTFFDLWPQAAFVGPGTLVFRVYISIDNGKNVFENFVDDVVVTLTP